jgi:hypothetical protein
MWRLSFARHIETPRPRPGGMLSWSLDCQAVSAVTVPPQWVAQPDFGRQIGIVAACWLPVVDLRRRIAASQKSDLSRDAGLTQSLE